MNKPPFQTYSLRELKNALKGMNKERYPDNYNAIIAELKRRKEGGIQLRASAIEIIPEDSLIIPFKFTGKTLEYFRIWIINLFLTILTVGVYSAWAKVRTKRYFYAHTYLDATAFEYLAEPINILKGRLLIVTGIIIYVAYIYAVPTAQILFILVFFLPGLGL